GGRTWTDVTPGKGTVHPSGAATTVGRTIVFGTQRGPRTFAVERSDDGGRTWRMSQPFTDPRGLGIGPPDVVDARHLFVAVDQGAAAGSSGESLWASSDGGSTWRFVSRTGFSVTRPGQLPFGCDKNGYGFATPSVGWATAFCAGGRPFVYRTDDGGRTWQKASLPGLRSCQCNVVPARLRGCTGRTTAGRRGARPFRRWPGSWAPSPRLAGERHGSLRGRASSAPSTKVRRGRRRRCRWAQAHTGSTPSTGGPRSHSVRPSSRPSTVAGTGAVFGRIRRARFRSRTRSTTEAACSSRRARDRSCSAATATSLHSPRASRVTPWSC